MGSHDRNGRDSPSERAIAEPDELPIIELSTDDTPGPARPRAQGTRRRQLVAAAVAIAVVAGGIVAVAASRGHARSRTSETVVIPPAPRTAATIDPGANVIGTMRLLAPAQGWAMNGIALFRTFDGGASWADITPPGVTDPFGHVTALTFLDPRHAWVAVSEPTFTLWRTTDGGTSWTALHPDVCAACGWMSGLDFLDARRGFAVYWANQGGGGTLAATTDGGSSWRVVGRTPFGGTVQFVDASTGWATDASDAIFHTTDGGTTWRRVAVPDPGATPIDSPAFVDARTVVAATAAGGRVAIARSLDGGTSWSVAVTPVRGASSAARLTATSASTWFLSDGAHLYTTTDAGARWITRTPTQGKVRELSFVSARDGWILADGRACLRTDADCPVYLLYATGDGGRTWTLRSPAAGVTANRSP